MTAKPTTAPAAFHELKAELAALLSRRILEVFEVEHQPSVQTPPRRDLGDVAFPAALHLAKTLRRKPREIAEELAAGFEVPDFVARVSVEGAGYLNVFLDRSACAATWLEASVFPPPRDRERKIIVEHTNINPNKAAHIGHLRNAVLGDVLVRALRRLGHPVEVQNYIDDTGVQLADVVVGFADLRQMTVAEVAALAEPFDYVCWDLYSKVGRWYEEDPERRELRQTTLHALESDDGPRAEMGRLVARRVVSRHLGTMQRIGVGYDVLTRESDILGLDFFTRAFEKLKSSGAVHLEEEGKNQGCWVMPLAESEEFAGLEDPDKVIVRSNGTVTYVGKDIAYQLWKFGLLGCDFGYRRWREEGVWETTSEGTDGEAPSFGDAAEVINVIDARQSYLQRIVRAGLEALGHHSEAERSIHFAYEMVSLSRQTAEQLGFIDADADGDGKAFLEMSGRKGIGVKADDLLDQLEAKSRDKIRQRYPDLSPVELDELARQIATAALRFFMVKATTTRVIAFDLEEALSFEGETGPYLQYSMVRERSIRRRLEGEGMATEVTAAEVRGLDGGLWADDLWDLVLASAQIPEVVERAADSLELSLIARHAIELASRFHAVYHRHRILGEADDGLRRVRMAANQIFRGSLEELLELIGVPVTGKM
ncbi:MAG: arginine--tRNA ligase [Thermoanaerobaculia bacterium]